VPKEKPWADQHFFAGLELAVFKLHETFLRFEKAFGETGAVNIVIVKAPSRLWAGRSCGVWRDTRACILQPFEGRILQITTRS
jgi:hypothetical protein